MSAQDQLRQQVTGTAVAQGSSAIGAFKRDLDKFKDQMTAALPKHISADRMARLALTQFSSNKGLQNCDPKSIFGAIVTASQLGLEPGVNGHCYLIPYGGKCTFVPGWKGIVDLVSRTGRGTVWTGAVFAGDDFSYQLGDRPFVHHIPMGEDDPNKITHVYAIGRVNKAEWAVIEVWPIERCKRHFKKMNKVGAKHYGHENWEMYCRKLPLLQVCKYMPSSVELSAAQTIDVAAEQGKAYTFDGEFVTLDGGDDTPDPNAGKGDEKAADTKKDEPDAKAEAKKDAPAEKAKGKPSDDDNFGME